MLSWLELLWIRLLRKSPSWSHSHGPRRTSQPRAYRPRFYFCKPARVTWYLSRLFLFSVSIKDAFVQSYQTVFSAIHVPLSWAPSDSFLTKSARACCRVTQRGRLGSSAGSRLPRFLLGIFYLWTSAPTTYALPGTNHAVIVGKKSLDALGQHQRIDTLISRLTSTTENTLSPTAMPAATLPKAGLNDQPYCFIVDTDSVDICIDTGANRAIVNDIRLLKELRSLSTSGVKGIGGIPVRVHRTGSLSLRLQSDKGPCNKVDLNNAVYVPTSPYNLVPPQLLYSALRGQGYDTKRFDHDDTDYVFRYRAPAQEEFRSLTVQKQRNGLFVFRTKPGFKSFFKQALRHDKTGCFRSIGDVKTTHLIANSDDESDNDRSISNTYTPPDNPNFNDQLRKPGTTPFQTSTSPATSGKLREADDSPNLVPFEDDDFQPISRTAILIDFDDSHQPHETSSNDPDIIATHRKRQQLTTMHERLGHLSFSKLNLLARAGIIPKELANVDPPTCPGCAYGKAHRKLWHDKGQRNINKIKPAVMSSRGNFNQSTNVRHCFEM